MSTTATPQGNGSIKLDGSSNYSTSHYVQITRTDRATNAVVNLGTLNTSQAGPFTYTDTSCDLGHSYRYNVSWQNQAFEQLGNDIVDSAPAVTMTPQADWVANPAPTLRYGWTTVASTATGWTLRGVTVSDTNAGTLDTLDTRAAPAYPAGTHSLPYNYTDTVTFQFVFAKSGQADYTSTQTVVLSATPVAPPTPPDPPPNYRVTAVSDTAASLAWDAPAGGADGYEVTNTVDGPGTITQIPSGTTTYTDSFHLASQRPITYSLRAYRQNATAKVYSGYEYVTVTQGESLGVLTG